MHIYKQITEHFPDVDLGQEDHGWLINGNFDIHSEAWAVQYLNQNYIDDD